MQAARDWRSGTIQAWAFRVSILLALPTLTIGAEVAERGASIADAPVLHPARKRGGGIDEVVFQVELFQLPAPIFEVPEGFYEGPCYFASRKLSVDGQVGQGSSLPSACLPEVRGIRVEETQDVKGLRSSSRPLPR